MLTLSFAGAVRCLFRWVCLCSAQNFIFRPIIVFLLYLPFGPWMVGELLDGHLGIIFSWAIFVYDSMLPGSLTFSFGFFLVTFYIAPLILILGYCIDCKLYGYHGTCSRLHIKFSNGLLGVWLAGLMYFTYALYVPYGWITLLVAPIRSWVVIMTVVIYLKLRKLSASQLKPDARLWLSSGGKRSTVDLSTFSDLGSDFPHHELQSSQPETFLSEKLKETKS